MHQLCGGRAAGARHGGQVDDGFVARAGRLELVETGYVALQPVGVVFDGRGAAVAREGMTAFFELAQQVAADGAAAAGYQDFHGVPRRAQKRFEAFF